MGWGCPHCPIDAFSLLPIALLLTDGALLGEPPPDDEGGVAR